MHPRTIDVRFFTIFHGLMAVMKANLLVDKVLYRAYMSLFNVKMHLICF